MKNIKVFLIMTFVIVCLLFTGCSKDTYHYYNEGAMTDYQEWISPDGVHYWYMDNGQWGKQLAPRYDHDGNLVIDK